MSELLDLPVSHPNLRDLYRQMKEAEITRQLFPVVIKGPDKRIVEFSVVFVAEGDPWRRVFGSRKITPVRYEEIRVLRPFKMQAADLKDDFIEWLRHQLGLAYDPDNPFTRVKFLRNHLIPQTPSKLRHRSNVKPQDMPVPSDGMEDGEKRIFLRWLPHYGENGNVTEENLAKTRDLISFEASLTCRKYNISSCWCDEYDKEQPISDPAELRR
jgi:hypothetical protein